ncbi:hypothetical protein BRADI_2g17918v3 [Brachypodium distachyon]|uniref:Uncharacterized protein n=1 Tax=Brachypodium distachyon TaxID=15368 RepID=A0A0Q3IGP4_BRADI|nr:hypothetical protein BRADI_2g17918v3 [Brachypodium distachyon]
MALRARTTPLLPAALAVAFLLSSAAEARVLLTLDDFGAVGDGIANDTQLASYSPTLASPSMEAALSPSSSFWFLISSPGVRRGLERGMRHGRQHVPQRPRRQVLPDLARHARRPLPRRNQAPGTSALQFPASVVCFLTDSTVNQAAPKAVHFEGCEDVSVMGITVQNSPRQHLAFTRYYNVKANYLQVTAPEGSPGTVGVLLASSTNVHVMDDLFSVGGDCVSIVGNCTDVRLRSVSCGPGAGRISSQFCNLISICL